LRASRAVYVSVVGIDITTASTSKDTILARRRFEAPTPQLCVNSDPGKANEHHYQIGEDELMYSHLVAECFYRVAHHAKA